MVQTLRMPMMGNTMETGLLVEWVVEEDASVKVDDVVAIVESEKAVADITANQDGVLARVDVAEEEEVPPGTLIGVVLGPDESIDEAPPQQSPVGLPDEGTGVGEERIAETSTAAETAPATETPVEPAGDEQIRAVPGARRLAGEADVELSEIEGTGSNGAVLRADVEEHLDRTVETEASSTGESQRTFASPSTRRLARELDVSLNAVTGTGRGDRVTESDVRAVAGRTNRETPPMTDPSEDVVRPVRRDPTSHGVTITEERELSGTRRTIAERMTRSARQAPQVTLNREIDVERAFETAEELSIDDTQNVGFMDVLLAAAIRALEIHPEFNAWFERETLRLVAEVNVAIAIDAEGGLVTPVIREASERGLTDIARERRRLTDAVLGGTYSIDDLQGGTFTITNLGMFGVDSFNPIINPPQVAILGVGRARGGSCTLSLSFDHRVVDGGDAARFLDTLVSGLATPSILMIQHASDEKRDETGEGADSDSQSVELLVERDLKRCAQKVAAHHGWPVPSFKVELADIQPTVTVDEPGSTSDATLRRLTYAACRESQFATVITGLRDPDVTVV